MEHLDGKLSGLTAKLLVHSPSSLTKNHVRALLDGADDVGKVQIFIIERGYILQFSNEQTRN